MENQKQRLIKKEAEIENLIKKSYNSKSVIKDGIVDIDLYIKAKYKILWVLKEPHDKSKELIGWDMRDLLNDAKYESGLNPDMKSTFPLVIYSTYSILNDLIVWDKIPYMKDDSDLIDILKSIAIINIKKLPASSQSKDNEIQDAYNQYKSIILKQIMDYEPDIIICGNTFKYMKEDLIELLELKEPKTQNYPTDHYYNDKKLVIDTYHPNQKSITHIKYFEGIIDAVKKWEKSKK